MDSIIDKYIWTGKSEAKLPYAVKGIRTIEPDNIIGVWNYFRIIFEDRILKGDCKTIEYAWPTISNCTSSSPFFSSSTDEPTKHLKLILDMGQKYANLPIVLEEARAVESDFEISAQAANLDEHGRYTWDVPRVKRFRHYRIRWSWQNTTIPNLPN